MKRLILFLFAFHFSLLAFAQMNEVFASMPDSLLPLLPEKARRDMLDFYQNHMEAKVRNRLSEYAFLDTLTDTYLRLTSSKASTVEIKLLQTSDSLPILALIRTVAAPIRDSHVEFYDTLWHRLPWLRLPVPTTAEYFPAVPDSLRPALDLVQRSIDDLRLVEVTVSPDAPIFTLQVSAEVIGAPLASEQTEDIKSLARRFLCPLRYRWTGREFLALP